MKYSLLPTTLLLLNLNMVCFSSNPQIDSLLSLLNTLRDDKDKGEIFQEIGYAYIYENPDSALFYTGKGMELSSQAKDTFQVAFCHNNYGVLYTVGREFGKASPHYREGIRLLQEIGEEREASNLIANYAILWEYRSETDSAIYYNELALAIEKKEGFEPGMGKVYLNIGRLYFSKGFYKTALDYYFKSLKIFEANDSNRFRKTALAHSYYNICTCLLELKEFEKGRQFCDKAKGVYVVLEHTQGTAGVASAIGYILGSTKKPGEALGYLRTAYGISQKINEQNLLAEIEVNFTTVFKDLGQLDSAVLHINKGIELAAAGQNQVMLAYLHQAAAEVYATSNQIPLALVHANKAVEAAGQSGMLKVLPETFSLVSKIYETNGQPALALEYHKKYAAAKDSLLDREKQTAIAELEISYRTLEKEKENALLIAKNTTYQASLERSSLRAKGLTLLAVILAASLAMFLWFFQKLKKARDKNATLLVNAYHNIKNNLQQLASILGIQNRQIADGSAKELLRENQLRVEAIKNLHQQLLFNKTGQAEIRIKDYLEQIAHNISNLYQPGMPTNFSFKTDIDDVLANHKVATSLGMVATELLTNAFKHAFNANHPQPLVGISVKLEGHSLHMVVEDNGKGFQKENDGGAPSFGMNLIHLFLENINGEMTTSNNGGMRFDIYTPNF